jgi:hypothetical protein
VEKLVVVGQNTTWKRDRNLYSRLLLSMILSKSVVFPFDTNPPDGPLSPFPSHLKAKLKYTAGPHESFFWRDIYGRIISTSSGLQDHHEGLNKPLYQNNMTTFVSLDPSKKETDNLRQLIQEQCRRIEILEDQMNVERLRHESEIARLLEHHKAEVSRHKQLSSVDDDHYHTQGIRTTRRSQQHSQTPRLSHSAHLSIGTPYMSRSSDGRVLRSFETTRSPSPNRQKPLTPSHDIFQQRSPIIHPSPVNEDSSFYSKPGSSEPNTALLGSPSDETQTHTQHPHRHVGGKDGEQSYLSRPNSSKDIFLPNNPYTFSPKPDLHPQGTPAGGGVMREGGITSTHSTPKSEFHIETGKDENSSDNFFPPGVLNQEIPDDENEFLNYLEGFQSEMRNLRFQVHSK